MPDEPVDVWARRAKVALYPVAGLVITVGAAVMDRLDYPLAFVVFALLFSPVTVKLDRLQWRRITGDNDGE